MPPRLVLDALTRSYPSGGGTLTVLDGVNLQIDAGEFVAILGPSGSGKSTMLALMAGLDRPTSGAVRVDGEALHDRGEDALARWRRKNLGFVFQSFQLLDNFTAEENVMFPLELLGDADPARRAAELLALVGLSRRAHHYPAQLSGGEQQRVALARAFAADPPILLADEPTGNLDSETGRQVLDVLIALHKERKTTVVLVTHDPSVGARADRRVYFKDGRIEREERS